MCLFSFNKLVWKMRRSCTEKGQSLSPAILVSFVCLLSFSPLFKKKKELPIQNGMAHQSQNTESIQHWAWSSRSSEKRESQRGLADSAGKVTQPQSRRNWQCKEKERNVQDQRQELETSTFSRLCHLEIESW